MGFFSRQALMKMWCGLFYTKIPFLNMSHGRTVTDWTSDTPFDIDKFADEYVKCLNNAKKSNHFKSEQVEYENAKITYAKQTCANYAKKIANYRPQHTTEYIPRRTKICKSMYF